MDKFKLMISMKFGGTSMGSPESMQNAADIVRQEMQKDKVTVVVSAVSGITDMLISLANSAISENGDYKEKFLTVRNKHSEIINGLFKNPKPVQEEVTHLLDTLEDFINGIRVIKELSPHSYDYISSYGERLSATIFAHFLSSQDIPAKALMADEFVVTNTEAGKADPLLAESKRKAEPIINDLLKQGTTPVITGFMGRSTEGKITTLGRGGSDYSAAIIGYITDASEIQIWTDVSGFYTTDPRICEHAKPHEIVSFREASELARFGAKVLHPRTLLPARENKIPVKIKNTFAPKDEGTTITFDESLVPETLKGVSLKKGVKLITICSSGMLMTHGFLAKIFDIFNKNHVSVDIVATSEVTVTVSTEDDHIDSLVTELKELGEITVHDDLNIVCIIGSGLKNNVRKNAEILNALADAGIDVKVIMQGSTQINFSLIVEAKDSVRATQLIHASLFEQ